MAFVRFARNIAALMLCIGAAFATPAFAQQARDVNAGPLWNQADAERKCPGVCQQSGGQWNGHWRTTEWGRMSVCNCQAQARPEPPRHDHHGRQPRGQWTTCAAEGQSCYIPYGTTVAYGANGQWQRRQFNGPAQIECSNRTFGDPAYGVRKTCQYQTQTTMTPPPPPPQPRAQWTRCANENGRCMLPYPATVAYGANGIFTQRRFNAGPVDCSNRTFGDPLPNVVKFCQFFADR